MCKEKSCREISVEREGYQHAIAPDERRRYNYKWFLVCGALIDEVEAWVEEATVEDGNSSA